MKKIVTYLLVVILGIAVMTSLCSCDIIYGLISGGGPTEGPLGSLEGEKEDNSNALEQRRAELLRNMEESWSATEEFYGYKLLGDANKSKISSRYASQCERLAAADTFEEIDAIDNEFFEMIANITNNDPTKIYIKESVDYTLTLGKDIGEELASDLVGKTLVIEFPHCDTEELVITEDFYLEHAGTITMLTDITLLFGYPVPFEDGAFAYSSELVFSVVPELSGDESVLEFDVEDENPLGWKSIKLYDGIYAEIDGKKFAHAVYSEDRLVLTYNGYEVFMTVDSLNSRVSFERPTADLMMTLTYEGHKKTYVFEIYGVRTEETISYETKVTITDVGGRRTYFTAHGYFTNISGYENTFDFPMLDLGDMQYDENGNLTVIDGPIHDENK